MHPDARLRVYAIWFDVLRSDDRSVWDDSLLRDPRVIRWWDSETEVGRWFGEREEFRDLAWGPLAWDIFFLFGPDARWEEVPGPLISSGSTIISKRELLKDTIRPFLEQ